jgi:hypothetical protein
MQAGLNQNRTMTKIQELIGITVEPNYYEDAEKAYSGAELLLVRAAMLATATRQRIRAGLGLPPERKVFLSVDVVHRYFKKLDISRCYTLRAFLETIESEEIITKSDWDTLELNESVFIKIQDYA